MKRLLVVASLMTIGLTMGVGSAWGQENEKSGYAALDLFSNYVWRGQKLSDEWVVQPHTGFMYKSFGAELWANYDTETEEHNETDLTLYYQLSRNQIDIEAGYIYYGLDGEEDTQEIYGSFTLTNLFLTPKVTGYLDFDEGNGLYLEASVSHSHDLPRDMVLDLEALVSFNAENETTGSFTNFNTGELLAELTVPLYQDFTLTTTLGYTFPLTDSAEDRIQSRSYDGDTGHLYAGLGISVDF